MSEQARLWPVMLEFEPIAVYLCVGSDLLLSYRAKMMEEWMRPITLATGEKLDDLDIVMNVRAENDASRQYLSNFERVVLHRENNQERERVGLLCYVAASDARDDRPFIRASCQVEALVPKFAFDEMLATARLGRLPSGIRVDVKGMDSEIGSGWKWDNKTFPNLYITSIGFGGVPLVAQAADNKSDDLMPPTRSQLSELSEKLDCIRDSLAKLGWVVLIGVLILIFWIFR